MSWSDWFDGGERSDGDSNDVKDVDLKIKTDSEGNVTDVLVSDAEDGSKNVHDHYYEVNQGESGVVERVTWNPDDDD